VSAAIAIVGMACRYPDAATPVALWDNVLAGRRAFRRLPAERLRLDDYWSPDRSAPDCFYASKAAVLEGYQFDRVAYRVSGSTFRSTDLAHWLALDVAADALTDAGFAGGEGLPRATTGALVGNTLTGEFSRANTLRLRWPYVQRVVAAVLEENDWRGEPRDRLLAALEERFKAPFPPVDGDTLAGALSNTIAGRICNHFDLGGGGYTVDGACSASLLSVTTACAALTAGDLDVAIAGGVDLSIDPFELVGFAKAGALADPDMRVYDRRSTGFWPGEGCGMVVMMRAADALAEERRIYALVRGWGVSSDGRGGMTRPEVAGQLLAVQRAYRRAGLGIDTVEYFEGHGTGTAIGDRTELEVLSRARRAANPGTPAAIGTVKANIGHTKAAAGVAGLIKATLAVHTRVLPPTTGCLDPHPLLCEPRPALRVLGRGEPWPGTQPARAGVSSMGFGGINVHVVVESAAGGVQRTQFDRRTRRLLGSAQDVELLLLDADSAGELAAKARRLAAAVLGLSAAELVDLAASLQAAVGDRAVRAALVAASPEDLRQRLDTLVGWLDRGVVRCVDPAGGVFLGTSGTTPRVVYLFPGQGSDPQGVGVALRSRFACVERLWASVAPPQVDDPVATQHAQPRIVAGSLAGLRALRLAGIRASAAVGHSLGELTALHWAGAIDGQALVRIATIRGQLMAGLGRSDGAMASLAMAPEDVLPLLDGEPVGLACFNGPDQTVISGQSAAVERVMAAARRRGARATRLGVSHAFHSPLVAPAAKAFAQRLAGEPFQPLRRTVLSTVTGHALPADADLRDLLRTQVTEPVRFLQALRAAVADADLLVEVGPGDVLSRLAAQLTQVPVVALETGSSSLAGYLRAVGAAFALGSPVRHEALFAGRFSRPLDLERERRFLRNPCESAPVVALPPPLAADRAAADSHEADRPVTVPTIELLRQLVVDHAELPADAVTDDSRLLDELHLSSIAVGEIVVEATRRLGLQPPAVPSGYATATLAEVAAALDALRQTGGARQPTPSAPPGIAPWVRAFSVTLVEAAPPAASGTGTAGERGSWQVLAPAGYRFAALLGRALERSGLGAGVLVCLRDGTDQRQLGLLLEGARKVLSPDGPGRFVLVQSSGGAAAFAKTLYLEAPWVHVTVVDVPASAEAVQWVVAEVAATSGFSQVRYDPDGVRRVPVLRPLSMADPPGPAPFGPGDVLLVTGGGKGITAECALAVARDTGARLALLGRSDPASDAALAANLRRMRDTGVRFRYVQADVADAAAVRGAVAEVQEALGTVTGVLHGAGTNVPELLGRLDEATVVRTLAPKVAGLRAVLRALDRGALRVVVTFGSIIGRAGLRGEAAYALANEWMTALTEQVQAEQPACRCLAVEWSMWSGVGMAERLGAVEALARDGISPIGPDAGVAMLRSLLAAPSVPTVVVVTGRCDALPTLQLEPGQLPLRRFLERPLVHYPNIELVADAELSSATDPYLDDHVLDGQRLLPAVIGMEALAQAAMAVAGAQHPPVLERLEFVQPIVISSSRMTIRVAALVRGPGLVETVLRSSATGFALDHFRALCRFAAPDPPQPVPLADAGLPVVPLDPERELYGGLLFQAGRFRRVRRYRSLAATTCEAELDAVDPDGWFGPYLPTGLVLGDPGLRDACMHAVQCCVPGSTLVPVAVERLVRRASAAGESLVVVHATERAHDGDRFVYDLTVMGGRGEVLERWDGLELHAIRGRREHEPLPPALLGPQLERRLAELVPGASVAVAVEPVLGDARASRRARSDRAIQRALGRRAVIHRRPDGRPETAGGEFISAAHTEQVTLAVSSRRPVACDVEAVVDRPAEVWRGLLGDDGLELARRIATVTGEDEHAALTRVWSAAECVHKAGCWSAVPFQLGPATPDGWVLLTVGETGVATLVTSPLATQGQLAFAILTEGRESGWTPTSTGTWSVSRRPTSSATSTT
jgi:enediyne polyketide synthase